MLAPSTPEARRDGSFLRERALDPAAPRRDHRRRTCAAPWSGSRIARRSSSVTRATAPTYRQFWEETSRVARGLLVRGVKKGDRVGIWAPNCAEWVVVQYATARIGAILVNINPAYRTHELEYALKQSGRLDAACSRAAFRRADYVAMVGEVRLRLPGAASRPSSSDGRVGRRCSATRERLAEEELRAPRARRSSSTTRSTSSTRRGTTGFPKGATLTPPQHPQQRLLRRRALPLHRAGPGLHPGALLPLLRHGDGQPRAAPPTAPHGHPRRPASTRSRRCRRSQDERCTSLYGVPTMFIAELDHPDFASYDLSSLRTGIMAGSPCPVEVMKKVHRRTCTWPR